MRYYGVESDNPCIAEKSSQKAEQRQCPQIRRRLAKHRDKHSAEKQGGDGHFFEVQLESKEPKNHASQCAAEISPDQNSAAGRS